MGMSCTRAAITWEAVYLTRRILDPGTGCPASWTAPPELSEDRPTGGAVQARPAVGPFGAPSFHLSHSPSDMGLPRSTLRWAPVHVCARRQIRLYGKSKKSTHGHQTHLPARTRQRQMASGSSPRPHQPAATWREKSRVSIQSALTLDFLCHPKKSRVSILLPRTPVHPPRARRRAGRARSWASRGRSLAWCWSRGRRRRRRRGVARSGRTWPNHY